MNGQNCRYCEQAKEAHTPGPKGEWSGSGAANSLDADGVPPVERPHLRPSRGTDAERGKPVCVLACGMQDGKRLVRDAERQAGKGSWSKRRAFCNGAYRGLGVAPRESGQTSTRSSMAKNQRLFSSADNQKKPPGSEVRPGDPGGSNRLRTSDEKLSRERRRRSRCCQ